jgi:biotin carboxylase
MTLLVVHAVGAANPRRYLPSLSQLGDVVAVYDVKLTDEEELARLREGTVALRPFDGDEEAVEVGLALAADHDVDGVLTYSELTIRPVAELAARLGLHHHPPAAVARMRDKGLQRQALAEAGLPTPAWHVLDGEGTVEEALARVPLPAVLKPTNGMASILTRRLERAEDVGPAYREALRRWNDDPRLDGLPARFMLEEFVAAARWHEAPRFGAYVSVESLVHRGHVTHVTVTDKLALAPPFRETGDVQPSVLAPERRAAIEEMATAAIHAVGATDGAAHTELFLTPDGPRVIEVNGRLGANVAYEIASISDYDLLREIGVVALGRPPAPPPTFDRYATYLLPKTPAEDVEVTSVEGLDEVRRLPGVLSAVQRVEPGSRPDWRLGDGTVAEVHATAPTLDALLALQDQVWRTLRVGYRPLAPT